MNASKIYRKLRNEFSPTRRKVIRIIYRAEIQSPGSGMAVQHLLNGYADEIRRYGGKREQDVVRLLRRLAKEIETGRPRWQIYKDILPEDIVLLLRDAADNASIPPARIFQEYVPLKELGEKVLRSAKRKLLFPLALYFVATFGLRGTVDIYAKIGQEMGNFSPVVEFIVNHFLAINLVVGFFFLIPFVFFPEKIPGFSKIMKTINGFLALGMIKVMKDFSFTTKDIIQIVQSRFTRIKSIQRNMDGLLNLLLKSGIITPVESAEMKIGAELGEFGKTIETILKERKDAMADMNEILQSATATLGVLILTIPVGMVVMVMGAMLSNGAGAATPTP